MIKTLIVGFVAGLLARAIKPGNDAMGWIKTILLGIGGAYVGQFFAKFIGLADKSGMLGLAISVAGAIIILFAYELISSKMKD